MKSKVTQSPSRTIRRAESFLLIIGITLLGVIALVYGLYRTIQINQALSNSVAVYSVSNETFMDYHIDSKGERFPRYNIRYTYMVNNTSLTQSQEVNRDFYNQFSDGQQLVIYYDRNQPSKTLIDLNGLYGQSRAAVVVGAGATLLGALVLSLLYWLTFLRE